MRDVPRLWSAEHLSRKDAKDVRGGTFICFGKEWLPFRATRTRLHPYVLELIFSTASTGNPNIVDLRGNTAFGCNEH